MTGPPTAAADVAPTLTVKLPVVLSFCHCPSLPSLLGPLTTTVKLHVDAIEPAARAKRDDCADALSKTPTQSDDQAKVSGSWSGEVASTVSVVLPPAARKAAGATGVDVTFVMIG
jgi:hypothetical protein